MGDDVTIMTFRVNDKERELFNKALLAVSNELGRPVNRSYLKMLLLEWAEKKIAESDQQDKLFKRGD